MQVFNETMTVKCSSWGPLKGELLSTHHSQRPTPLGRNPRGVRCTGRSTTHKSGIFKPLSLQKSKA